MRDIRFVLDENMNPEIAVQLRRRDIPAVSIRDLRMLSAKDLPILEYAQTNGCVICTHDSDFTVMATQGLSHSGMVIAAHGKSTTGLWVRYLTEIYENYTAAEMVNQWKHLPVR